MATDLMKWAIEYALMDLKVIRMSSPCIPLTTLRFGANGRMEDIKREVGEWLKGDYP